MHLKIHLQHPLPAQDSLVPVAEHQTRLSRPSADKGQRAKLRHHCPPNHRRRPGRSALLRCTPYGLRRARAPQTKCKSLTSAPSRTTRSTRRGF